MASNLVKCVFHSAGLRDPVIKTVVICGYHLMVKVLACQVSPVGSSPTTRSIRKAVSRYIRKTAHTNIENRQSLPYWKAIGTEYA